MSGLTADDLEAIRLIVADAAPLPPESQRLLAEIFRVMRERLVAAESRAAAAAARTARSSLPGLHSFIEIAALLDIPARILREAARRREFDHVRIGVRYYMTAEQYEKFIASMTVAAIEPVDPLDAVRLRVARQRMRSAARGRSTV